MCSISIVLEGVYKGIKHKRKCTGKRSHEVIRGERGQLRNIAYY